MAVFGGTAHEHLEPTPVSVANISGNRLEIRCGAWVYEAETRDGVLYEGTYGECRVDPNRIVKLWCYPGPDGSRVLYGEWWYGDQPNTQGEIVFRLFPEPEGEIEAVPVEFDNAKVALRECQERVARHIAPLSLLLAHDRQTGRKMHLNAWKCQGLYVLFYNSGRIARVGQTVRLLEQRLQDYEPQNKGWFAYRWVGLIPFEAADVGYITPLENELLATIKPPQNRAGCT